MLLARIIYSSVSGFMVSAVSLVQSLSSLRLVRLILLNRSRRSLILDSEITVSSVTWCTSLCRVRMYACGADSKVSWLRSQAARAFPLKVTLSSGWISPYVRLNPSQLRDSGRFSLRFPCRVMHADALLLTWTVRKCKSFLGVLSYTVLSLSGIFDRLLDAFGPRHWWPGDSPLEISVGAILTQNTAWKNVEKAIANMREKGLLDAQRLKTIDPGEPVRDHKARGILSYQGRPAEIIYRVPMG